MDWIELDFFIELVAIAMLLAALQLITLLNSVDNRFAADSAFEPDYNMHANLIASFERKKLKKEVCYNLANMVCA